MKTKKLQVTKTDIRKVLAESAFDPRENSPLRIVAEVGDPIYYMTRATELIRDAQVYPVNVEDKIGQAISLLALAKANVIKKVRPTRS